MKKYFVVILMGLILQFDVGFAQKQFDYKIKGEIKGLNNDTLIFSYFDFTTNQRKNVKAAGNADKFSVSGIASKETMVFGEINKRRKEGNFSFFLENGTIEIVGDSKMMGDLHISGTPINNEFNNGNQITNAFYKQRDILYKRGSAIADKRSEAYQKIAIQLAMNADSLQRFRVNYIKAHPASIYSAMQLYLLTDKIDIELLDSLYTGLRPPAKNFSYLERLPATIQAKKASKLGNIAPDFEMKDSKGNMVKLKDFRGKYVLLDFWASWCVPCRAENPALLAAFKKFKDKPFEIISVSSDDNEAKWRKAIIDDQLEDWIHLSDLKGIHNAIAEKYGVQPIPDNFLIDPSGKIIARGLRGVEVEKRLVQIFTK